KAVPRNHVSRLRRRTPDRVAGRNHLNSVVSIGKACRAGGVGANEVALDVVTAVFGSQKDSEAGKPPAALKAVNHQPANGAISSVDRQPVSRTARIRAVQLDQQLGVV